MNPKKIANLYEKYGTVILNASYALLQMGMGFWHRSFWFFSLAGYYLSLVWMRLYLLRYTKSDPSRKSALAELYRYRTCGIVFLVMNLALSLMTFFMVYWNRTFHHHRITTIALAAYTFTAFSLAVIRLVKDRKSESYVAKASSTIGLASACVSMLILECTMLTTFGGDMSLSDRKLFLALSGGGASAWIIAMAIYMIVRAKKRIRLYGKKE